jgi:hypothetical protein
MFTAICLDLVYIKLQAPVYIVTEGVLYNSIVFNNLVVQPLAETVNSITITLFSNTIHITAQLQLEKYRPIWLTNKYYRSS